MPIKELTSLLSLICKSLDLKCLIFSGITSMLILLFLLKSIALSITFSNSLILPGQL